MKDTCGRGSSATLDPTCSCFRGERTRPWCLPLPPPYQTQAYWEPQLDRKSQPPPPPGYLPLLQGPCAQGPGLALGPGWQPPHRPLHTAACPTNLSPTDRLRLSLLQPTAPCSEAAAVSTPFLRPGGWLGVCFSPPGPFTRGAQLAALRLPRSLPPGPHGAPFPFLHLCPSLPPPTPSALPGVALIVDEARHLAGRPGCFSTG